MAVIQNSTPQPNQGQPNDPRVTEVSQSDDAKTENDVIENVSDEEAVDIEADVDVDSIVRLIRTDAYSELIVSTSALDVLQDDWGVVLSGAPAALGRLSQCFVLASEPLAASLVFSENSGLPYKSLRANLVHASDLGRTAFRDAESGMNRLSLVASGLCEPNGAIGKIVRDVEDPILAEIELPDQLAALKRMSDACVADTFAIKQKFEAWRDFASLIYRACVEEDETLKRAQSGLDSQVKDKKLSLASKSTAVNDTRNQAEYYNTQITTHRNELKKAEKDIPRWNWPWGRKTKKSNGLELSGAGVELGSTGLISSFMKLGVTANWTKRQPDGEPEHSSGPVADGDPRDVGYQLADRLSRIIHRLAELLTLGPDNLNGADWEQLAGRRGSAGGSIRDISRRVYDTLAAVQGEHSPVVRRVRHAMRPVEETLVQLNGMLRKEREVNAEVETEVADSAKSWRADIRSAEETLSEIVGEGLELAKRQVKELERHEAARRKTILSRRERRYERLRLAQKTLLEVEDRANQRRDRERVEVQELELMQQEFEKLLASEATMAQVKQIVRDCVKKLQDFCAQIEQLMKFFASMHQQIQHIDEMRIDPFLLSAGTTKKIGDLAAAQTDEAKKLQYEKLKERKLAELKVEALELKARYLVANAMTTTYVEVSKKYIMPGVAQTDRLSLPDAPGMTKEQRMEKNLEVSRLAREARVNVTRLANACRDQFVTSMSEKRGAIEDMDDAHTPA